eukprot:s541_g17.t1
MVASMASALDASLSYLSPKSDKENDYSHGNRDVQDVLSCSRKKLSLGSLGDRIRAEQRAQREPQNFVANSPEALPCTSEILPPQHLWTPHFTSPNSVEEVLFTEDSAEGAEAGEFDEIRQKVRAIRGALQRSNTQQAEMHAMLSQALERCESLKVEAADAQRSKEHHHHRWCILDQERETLQRMAQQSQSSEQSAREVSLKPAAEMLKHLKTTERSLQPELLAKMPSLYESLADALGNARASGAGILRASQKVEADERVAQLERQLAQKELALATLEQEKRSLRSEVRSLQNQELRGSIRVFCRIRPPRPGAEGASTANGFGVKAEGSRSVCLKKPPGDRRHDFNFDRVFNQQAGQRSFGILGAGKTYTLAGQRSSKQPGIQDLAIGDLLRLAKESFEVRLTALEIYNESIQDLLSSCEGASGPSRAPSERLEVRQSREGLTSDAETDEASPSPFGSMRVPGLKSWTVQDSADVEEALERVRTKRHVASTALNERSSRSHTVISLSVLRRSAGVESLGVPVGVLHIVDLAGSERTKVSQAEGLQMKEANCINRSLSALADVLFALGDSSSSAHVPYRNSKLTYLLQDALGGPGCKTFLFAQVSPDAQDAHESYSTLTFAARVATSVQKGRLRLRTGNVSPSPRRELRERDSPAGREESWRAAAAPPEALQISTEICILCVMGLAVALVAQIRQPGRQGLSWGYLPQEATHRKVKAQLPWIFVSCVVLTLLCLMLTWFLSTGSSFVPWICTGLVVLSSVELQAILMEGVASSVAGDGSELLEGLLQPLSCEGPGLSRWLALAALANAIVYRQQAHALAPGYRADIQPPPFAAQVFGLRGKANITVVSGFQAPDGRSFFAVYLQSALEVLREFTIRVQCIVAASRRKGAKAFDLAQLQVLETDVVQLAPLMRIAASGLSGWICLSRDLDSMGRVQREDALRKVIYELCGGLQALQRLISLRGLVDLCPDTVRCVQSCYEEAQHSLFQLLITFERCGLQQVVLPSQYKRMLEDVMNGRPS